MEDIKHNGYTYTVYIRGWLKGNKKYEVIKYLTGFRNLWERVSLQEYNQIKTQKNEQQYSKGKRPPFGKHC